MNSGGVFILRVLFALMLAASMAATGMAAPLTKICQIQGSGFTSPLKDAAVRIQGVVSADFDQESLKGLFIQDDDCDNNPATSDGVFVSLGEQIDIASVGDLVEVNGIVHEDYGRTEIDAAPGDVSLLSRGKPLPLPVELVPPFDNDQSRAYFESLEGMLVKLSTACVVGPTNNRSNTWVIRADLGLARVFRDDPLGTGEIVSIGGEGHYEIEPAGKVGDRILDLEGVLDYSLGSYQMVLLDPPTLIPGSVPSFGVADDPGSGFTFATFNFNNLFDWIDDPNKDDDVLGEAEYHTRLDKLALTLHDDLGEPTFIAVQEVENDIVLVHLLARETIDADYDFIWQEGPDTRGIDIALVYRKDQVSVQGYEARQGCTSLVDGFGPDGNRDTSDPKNAVTCDTDGDGQLDGNRLFSRPPLVLQLQVNPGDDKILPLWVIANHWKSKLEDTDYQAYTASRRLKQARFVASLGKTILTTHPGANLIVLGDLNDFPDSESIARLTQTGLRNVMNDIPYASRYTYIYKGVSQILDYAFISPALSIHRVTPQPIHLNADYPTIYQDVPFHSYRSSDHDPILFHLDFLSHHVYLPLLGW